MSVAVVRDDSPIRTADDLRGLFWRGEGRLLFVDPLSVSGALAPRVALAAERIPLPESRIRYTHSHTNSLRRFARMGATTRSRSSGTAFSTETGWMICEPSSCRRSPGCESLRTP